MTSTIKDDVYSFGLVCDDTIIKYTKYRFLCYGFYTKFGKYVWVIFKSESENKDILTDYVSGLQPFPTNFVLYYTFFRIICNAKEMSKKRLSSFYSCDNIKVVTRSYFDKNVNWKCVDKFIKDYSFLKTDLMEGKITEDDVFDKIFNECYKICIKKN